MFLWIFFFLLCAEESSIFNKLGKLMMMLEFYTYLTSGILCLHKWNIKWNNLTNDILFFFALLLYISYRIWIKLTSVLAPHGIFQSHQSKFRSLGGAFLKKLVSNTFSNKHKFGVRISPVAKLRSLFVTVCANVLISCTVFNYKRRFLQ